MTKPTRPNAAAARRLRGQLRTTPVLSAERTIAVAGVVASYAPRGADETVWLLVRPAVIEALTASNVAGTESMRKHATHLAHFYLWVTDRGLNPNVASLDRRNIETYISSGMPACSAKSRADRRARLRALADSIHGLGGDPAGPVIARPPVKPPYTPAEMEQLRTAALTQPTPGLQRALCMCIGLGAGAGLGPADFRGLHGGHIVDRGQVGLVVTVPEGRRREVPVLAEYENLLRVGLDGLDAKEPILPGRPGRKNLAARAVEDAVLLGDTPRLEQSRLRHTWLATMLTHRIPLHTLLYASGLRSARTLTDIAEHLPQPDVTDQALLRCPGVTR